MPHGESNSRGNLLSKGSVDTTLSGDSVTSRREKFRNTGSVEASLGQTESGTQTGTPSTDDDGIVLVVLARQLDPCRISHVRQRVAAYNDGVFLSNKASVLLGAQRVVGEDPGLREDELVG